MDNKKDFWADAHKKAFNKAKKKLPDKKITDVLKLAEQAVKDKDPVALAKELGLEYKDFIFEYSKALAEVAIDQKLKDSDKEALQKLAKKKLGKSLVSFSIKAAASVHKYMDNKITAEELAYELYHDGLKEVADKIIKSFELDQLDLSQVSAQVKSTLGVDMNMLTQHPEMLVKLSVPIITYNAFMGAYKELNKALNDLELAKEQRIAVEVESKAAVEMIVSSRKEMEERVSEYLTGHIEMFEEGFSAMDQAILDNDTDGFIRGNVTIQKALGYDVQFTNQEEFDDLMDSDEAFKL